MSYKNLEIWKLSRENVIGIHKMTLTEIPKFELYEEGSQIRRSSKSVKTNIVEGYGRREYKQDFIRFLTFSLASNDETLDHLETLWETESLKNEELYNELHEKIDKLGRKLNLFLNLLKNTDTSMEITALHYSFITERKLIHLQTGRSGEQKFFPGGTE